MYKVKQRLVTANYFKLLPLLLAQPNIDIERTRSDSATPVAMALTRKTMQEESRPWEERQISCAIINLLYNRKIKNVSMILLT